MVNSLSKYWQKFAVVVHWDRFDISQLYFFAGVTSLGFLLEIVIVGWKDSSLKRLLNPGPSETTDIIIVLLNLFTINRVLGVLLTFGVWYYLAGLVYKLGHFDLMIHITNPIAQFVLLLLISDLKSYTRHFIFHRISPLWEAHQFHHSAEEFTMITNHRNHFVENAIGKFFDVFPYVILGSTPQTFFLIQPLRELHQMMIHGRSTSDWGFIGKYILVSPALHRVHHSVLPEHHGKNFGSLFIFWDRLFGTYHPAVEVPAIGLPGAGFNTKGFLHDYWSSYTRIYRRIWQILQRSESKKIM